MDIQQLITEIKQDVNQLGNTNYCIILYTTSGFLGSVKKVRKIYKNFEEFQNKIEEHTITIDTMFGIDVQVYVFD